MSRLSICLFVAFWVAGYPLASKARADRPSKTSASGVDPTTGKTDAAKAGYRFLLENATVPSDFDQETFDVLWKVWPEPLRTQAENASSEERRQMTFARYGLTSRPGDTSEKPLQYVVDSKGRWTQNCFTCHGGTVYGEPMPGAPNNRFALQTLTEDISKAKLGLGKLPGQMELGSLFIPLGTTNGTTNAVVFGMALLHGRDADLNVVPRAPKWFTHHDMDAPAWWHFHKRPQLYIDGFAQKGHRALMQFSLVPENGPDFFHRHEDEFRKVYAYMESLRPPKYPYAIDEPLASKGRALFESNCAECHGTYGSSETYPNVRVPIEELQTDPVRLRALTVEGREKYAMTWFAHAGEPDEHKTVTAPKGYVAPPLDGVWASAPYLHNGSVPTLWGILHPESRPTLWRPTSQQMDEEKVGLTVQVVDAMPADIEDPIVRRSYFDTRKFGKSNRGHDFPASLSEAEKRAMLEYLKTL